MDGSGPMVLEVGIGDMSLIAQLIVVRACFVRRRGTFNHLEKMRNCSTLQCFFQGIGSLCRGKNIDVNKPIKRPCNMERKERPVESRIVKSLSGGVERKRGGRRHREPLGGRGSQAERKRGEQRR
ncbi:unnamed protein product [Sphagnum balticum]